MGSGGPQSYGYPVRARESGRIRRSAGSLRKGGTCLIINRRKEGDRKGEGTVDRIGCDLKRCGVEW
jgi:hypothetical protein